MMCNCWRNFFNSHHLRSSIPYDYLVCLNISIQKFPMSIFFENIIFCVKSFIRLFVYSFLHFVKSLKTFMKAKFVFSFEIFYDYPI